MKIRTITLGISEIPTLGIIRWAGEQLERASDHFSSCGYSVQSRRLALNHWDASVGSMPTAQRTDLFQMVDALSTEAEITSCSIGIANVPEQIEHMAQLLAEYPRLSACAEVGSFRHGLHDGAKHAAAQAIRYLGLHSDRGFANFRFGAGFCLEAGHPFFPGAYHKSDIPFFTIGFENSDLLVDAFSNSDRLETARERLFNLLISKYLSVEKAALDLAEIINLPLGGIDTSIAPSLHSDESIVCAFRGANIEFGMHGTLAACGMVTDVLKSLPIRSIGYCGIMLPVLEDVGLAKAADEERFGVNDLLAYSSVCGVGVDMVPIPGDVSLNEIEALMLDTAVMALKLRKPLSVRLLPVPGKRAGERTQFDSPYVCNSRVMTL